MQALVRLQHFRAAQLPVLEAPSIYSAPTNRTQTIYHGTDKASALECRDKSYAKAITTKMPGDFHWNFQQRPTAYFIFDKDFARECRPPGGKIIKQQVPREMLRKGYNSDAVPDNDCNQVRIPYAVHSENSTTLTNGTVCSEQPTPRKGSQGVQKPEGPTEPRCRRRSRVELQYPGIQQQLQTQPKCLLQGQTSPGRNLCQPGGLFRKRTGTAACAGENAHRLTVRMAAGSLNSKT
jgi:hypothetical protein